MTTLALDVLFITGPAETGATIHAATAVGMGYISLCYNTFPHDTPEYKFTADKTLTDVCVDCRDRLASLGMPVEGRSINDLGTIASDPNLMRAIQHVFEAARHISGYCKLCPVCGGTQVDGDEGCRMCAPLVNIHAAVETLNKLANHMLEIEDPFEGVPR